MPDELLQKIDGSIEAKHVQTAGRLLGLSANVVAEFGRCPLSTTLNLVASALTDPVSAEDLHSQLVTWARRWRGDE